MIDLNRFQSPLWHLTLARIRLFFREPSTVFWAVGFPVLLTVALGVAFRNRPPDPVVVLVQEGAGADTTLAALVASPDVKARITGETESHNALRAGKASLVVVPGATRTYLYDSTRPESRLARTLIDDVLQRAGGRVDAVAVTERLITEPGSRYIDFLVPGLIGMNVMSSSMWGVGYLIVESRTRKQLKRFLATPMKRSDFLLSLILSRLMLLFLELPVLILFPAIAFGVTCQGSLALFVSLAVLGAFSFAGIGILVGARAQNTQTVGGLMNLVMMPMFIGSGVFFSSANFPEAAQPFIRALPLTALNEALRAVMNEGAGLAQVWPQLLVVGIPGILCLAIALRIFRWS